MRSLLTLAFWTLYIPIAALIAFPWTFITGDARLLYRLGVWGARVGVRVSGVRARVVGADQLDRSRAYIFMSNHVSNLDPPLMLPLIPVRTSVMAKQELFRIPILGRAMLLASLVPVDRSNRDAAVASVHRAAEVIRSGISMTVFPEGTRSPDGRLLPFKKGPFYLALETGAPIVPITIIGTDKLLPKGKKFARSGTVDVIFHAPIDTTQFADRDRLIAAVRDSIASALPVETQIL
jgi:1-acyl-sn-glycerol-3-phosphate acyltransferase